MEGKNTNKDVIDWAKKATDHGAGEILLTSVDNEGTLKGFDDNLVREICKNISLPVIISGGFGKPEHIVNPLNNLVLMQLQLPIVFTITNSV